MTGPITIHYAAASAQCNQWVDCAQCWLLYVARASADERDLIEYLFERQNYNPLIRPVQNLSHKIEVGFEMALIQLINLVSNERVINFPNCDSQILLLCIVLNRPQGDKL